MSTPPDDAETAREMAKLEAEPLLLIEKQLIFGSLILGFLLLGILLWLSNAYFSTIPQAK